MYNYRPQKNDELELCSGEHYKVLEKGTDGWFKGFPVLGRQEVGHFPGNYVRPVRLVWFPPFIIFDEIPIHQLKKTKE